VIANGLCFRMEVPDLHFDIWDPEGDHFFHEFESVEGTEESSTATVDISEFLPTVKGARKTFV
jgi:hypothetical protein